jgi:hypothetical protein
VGKLAATTSLQTEVKLSPRVKAQIRVQLYEYAELQRAKKEIEAKQAAIKEVVEIKFADADEIDALMNGTEIDGFRIKMVVGSTSRIDKKKLVALGVDLEEVTTTTDNKPYLKISAPGEKE